MQRASTAKPDLLALQAREDQRAFRVSLARLEIRGLKVIRALQANRVLLVRSAPREKRDQTE